MPEDGRQLFHEYSLTPGRNFSSLIAEATGDPDQQILFLLSRSDLCYSRIWNIILRAPAVSVPGQKKISHLSMPGDRDNLQQCLTCSPP